MLFNITHRTHYQYSHPVFLEPFTVRLRPRCDATQTLRSYRVDVSPEPSGITHCHDLYGTNTETVWFGGLHDNLLIEVHSVVETHYGNSFDFIISDPNVLTLPSQYPPAISPVLEHYLVRDEPFPLSFALAQEIKLASRSETVPFLTALAEAIYQRLEYMLREHGDPWTPDETLRQGKGSCRDSAMLFIDACRSVGIAARFVSGYCFGDASIGGDMHAWAEVYLPGAGWRGFDPSRGLSVNDDYIVVSAAQQSQGASPTSGSFRGEASAHMTAQIDVSLETIG